MKIIVTHSSPDLDAITSIWLLKKFLPGWEDAEVRFVPAGESLNYARRLPHISSESGQAPRIDDPIEKIGGDEVVHVDTGLGPLDHHQTKSDKVCAASLAFDFVEKFGNLSKLNSDKKEAVSRIVKIIIDIDHFKEVFWANPTADYHEFSLLGILDGLKLQKPDQDNDYVEFTIQCLDALLHNFENRIWAEREIRENGHVFNTRFGKGIGFETINDDVIKLAQKMGYVLVLRKDPRKGYIRVKAKPSEAKNEKRKAKNKDIDLTLTYERLKKMDPNATWFLHISKKMLLNGSVKNPKMRPTKLSLSDIIKVLIEI